jgi:hypothetical protein
MQLPIRLFRPSYGDEWARRVRLGDQREVLVVSVAELQMAEPDAAVGVRPEAKGPDRGDGTMEGTKAVVPADLGPVVR